MAKSSQDIRRDILDLRDELVDDLNLIRRAIRQDREKLTAYFERFGDLRYRPVTKTDIVTMEKTYGEPTEIVIEPLATQLRTTIKTLIDSIKAIETEILPEDNPEGQDALKGDSDTLQAREEMRRAFEQKSHVETQAASGPAPVEDTPIQRMAKPPKEEHPAIAKAVTKPTPTNDSPKGDWRSTTPKALPATKATIVETPTEKKPEASQNKTPRAIGLSPEMRAKLGMSPQMPGPPLEREATRMDDIRAKYMSDDGDEEP